VPGYPDGVTEGPAEAPRLEILKALGDNTRYAIYLELARSPKPIATAEIAETLDLHPNTVRPHLERMREVGLLDQRVDTSGGVGRPQHLYSLAPDSPSLGLEPPAMAVLARMLVHAAVEAGMGASDAAEAGQDQGRADAADFPPDVPCVEALMAKLAELGFDPEVEGGEGGVTVAFTHCPFRELAEANPDLVCSLHRGMVEGLVGARPDGKVAAFRNLVDRSPCQVDLTLTGGSL
jgi:predicted ArsR family transcriptional regulator